MSITFREFVELAEGKKKKEKIERLKSAYMAGQEQAPRQAVNIPAGEPNSPDRAAAIKELMRPTLVVVQFVGQLKREKRKQKT